MKPADDWKERAWNSLCEDCQFGGYIRDNEVGSTVSGCFRCGKGSDDPETGVIATLLLKPLVVHAADSVGRPMNDVSLSLSVAKGDGFMISGQNRGRSLVVHTDSNGNAGVQLQLGSRVGAAANQIIARAAGFVGQVVFCEDSTAGSPKEIHTVSGEMQTGIVGEPLAEPLVAIVLDAGGNPVADIPVTFVVKSGGGLISDSNTFALKTDADGKAYAILVTGQQEGTNNNVVTAAFDGEAHLTAVFTSSGAVPGLASNTKISGIVLDGANQPVPQARTSIAGTSLSATTDAQGQFTISGAPAGELVLFIDGQTSTRKDTFPTLSFHMVTIPGIDNTLGHPIFLPVIDTANSQVVGGDQPVELTMTGVPGLIYTVAPHSATFPDGSHVGRVTLSQVHADKVPMIPPNGAAPRLVGTLQPAGVAFNPPIKMQLPNTDGLIAGQVVEIFSFHHDVEQFVVEGTARDRRRRLRYYRPRLWPNCIGMAWWQWHPSTDNLYQRMRYRLFWPEWPL